MIQCQTCRIICICCDCRSEEAVLSVRCGEQAHGVSLHRHPGGRGNLPGGHQQHPQQWWGPQPLQGWGAGGGLFLKMAMMTVMVVMVVVSFENLVNTLMVVVSFENLVNTVMVVMLVVLKTLWTRGWWWWWLFWKPCEHGDGGDDGC